MFLGIWAWLDGTSVWAPKVMAVASGFGGLFLCTTLVIGVLAVVGLRSATKIGRWCAGDALNLSGRAKRVATRSSLTLAGLSTVAFLCYLVTQSAAAFFVVICGVILSLMLLRLRLSLKRIESLLIGKHEDIHRC